MKKNIRTVDQVKLRAAEKYKINSNRTIKEIYLSLKENLLALFDHCLLKKFFPTCTCKHIEAFSFDCIHFE